MEEKYKYKILEMIQILENSIHKAKTDEKYAEEVCIEDFIEEKEILEYALRELERLEEYYQYCRKQEMRINDLLHKNESLEYRLSIMRLSIQEKKEELEKELEELESKSSLEMRFSDWQMIDNTKNKIQVLKEILGEEGGE